MSEKENLIKKYHVKSIPDLLKTPINRLDYFYPTGFEKLDDMIGGGLKPGLHFLTGFAASGKSTMVAQIALQMSSRGIPVLYFSSEMADKECVCRMLTFVAHSVLGRDKYTANDFLNLSDYDSWSEEKKFEVQEIVDTTAEKTKNIYLSSTPTVSLTVSAIHEIVKEFMKENNTPPAVFIDCLHMLRTDGDEEISENQRIQIILHQLKNLTDDFNIPVLCTTWISRSQYDKPISLKSLKQSNYIALYATTILGLQLEGCAEKWFDFVVASGKNPRKLELVVLKNTNAMVGQTINYELDLKYNVIQELHGNTYRR